MYNHRVWRITILSVNVGKMRRERKKIPKTKYRIYNRELQYVIRRLRCRTYYNRAYCYCRQSGSRALFNSLLRFFRRPVQNIT